MKQRIAEYRLERELGRGGMGVVYLGEHVTLQRKVAVKVLSQELDRDPEFRERFLREARLAASLDHPNVLPVYDAGEAEGQLFLATRLVQGSDLGVELEGGPIAPERAVAILAGVAGALDDAHAHGLVHRDVKPSNVLLEPGPTGERVFLADFGLTRPVEADASGAGPITRSGVFVGTPHYAAPEQIQGERIDGRADQYSLAAVLYQCLTGRFPYERTNDTAVLVAHVTEPPPSLGAARPDLPAALDHVIARGMAKDPRQRYPTCAALVADARAALGGGVVPPPPPPTIPSGERRPRRRLSPALTIGAGGALAVVVGLLIVLLGSGGGPRPGPSTAPPGTTGPTGPTATEPSQTPTSPPLSQTRVVTYSAFDPGTGKITDSLNVVKRVPGSCFTSSVATNRPDAWRCSFEGKRFTILADPCFSTFGGDFVVCPKNPIDPDVTVIDLTEQLPSPFASGPPTPGSWAVQLADGNICLLVQGTGTEIAGQRVNYFCDDGFAVVGNIDTRGELFHAQVGRTGSSEITREPLKAVFS